MNTKIIFFDFDNTLYSHNTNSIPESVYVALKKLKDKGILTCLCTGRCKYQMDRNHDLSGLDFDYYIYFGGQLILDKNCNVLYTQLIEGIDKENAVRLFKEKTIPVILESKDDYYINFINEQVYQTCVVYSSSPLPTVHDYVEDDLYMLSILPGQMDNLDKFIKENFPNCFLKKWCDGSYDVLINGSNKAKGISALIKMLNINVDETMSFGDGKIDIEMLDFTGISIAMGNSDDSIKAHSDYVTDDVDNNGIYNALVEYNLI